MLNQPLVGKKGRRRGSNKVVSDVYWHNPINSHLRPQRCVLRVVVLIDHNSNVPACVRVDEQQRSLMLARGSLATCYINVPMVDQTSSSNVLE